MTRNRIGGADPNEGHDARAQIQTVALELFIANGYDKTSLREIAERLGVTKAALYYHFPTKDDIINSLLEDRVSAMRGLIDWAKEQPRTLEARRELLQRYSTHLYAGNARLTIRFFERNQTVMKTLPAGERMRDLLVEMLELLVEPGDPLTVRLKRSMAIFAIHAGLFILREEDGTDEDRQHAAVQVAMEMLA